MEQAVPQENELISSNKATIILQGRLGSTRLPGKVMLPLAGKPAILHVYERICYCRNIDKIIVATTTNPEDDVIEKLFSDKEVDIFRGSADDPLDRYYQAALRFDIGHVVRIMSDCPLVDPQIVDELVASYFSGGYDLVHLDGEFPTGLDVTVFSRRALEKNWQESTLTSDREHITSYISNNPDKFKVGVLNKFHGLLHHRWVMDEKLDYQFISQIYDALYQEGTIFKSNDILNFLAENPQILKINAGIPRNQGYLQTRKKDLKLNKKLIKKTL
ncbi:MAG: glycosyltransferase family protein [Magnetococcales bacterium]|nr:glycosyltransferase family protein [Magnetococcales bacterium]